MNIKVSVTYKTKVHLENACTPMEYILPLMLPDEKYTVIMVTYLCRRIMCYMFTFNKSGKIQHI
jgi:hypothetical protein